MVSVDSGVPWPEREQTVAYAGHEILSVPPRRDEAGNLEAYPLAAIKYERGTQAEVELVTIIRRFINALAWREQVPIREIDVIYGAPLRVGTRIPDNFTTPRFDGASVPDPVGDKARLALAFYREGLVLRTVHIAYSFLSFFKVLNVKFPKGPEQITWINSVAGTLTSREATVRVAELTATEPDVGAYLYGSGRCAVAHAFSDPLIDPDDITDQQRLSRDLPVARSLAARLIQAEWGVPAPPWQAVG
jgi:hypothetical protein